MRRLSIYLLPLLIFHMLTELFSHFYLLDIFTLYVAEMVGLSPLIVWSIVQIVAILFIFWLLFIKNPRLLKFGYIILGMILIFEISHFFEYGSVIVKLSAGALLLFGVVYWLKLIPFLRIKTL